MAQWFSYFNNGFQAAISIEINPFDSFGSATVANRSASDLNVSNRIFMNQKLIELARALEYSAGSGT
jgi:hypothetical protein